MNGYRMDQYELTHDWVSMRFPLWEKIIQPPIPMNNVLEIGCYEGRATLWFLHQFTESYVTCIDTFEGGSDLKDVGIDFEAVLDRFRRNLEGFTQRMTVLNEGSYTGLIALNLQAVNFGLIMVDGSHEACDVLSDIVLSWPMLVTGGYMILDDYSWGNGREEVHTPKPAIDAFLECYAGRYELLHKDYQVIVRKL